MTIFYRVSLVLSCGYLAAFRVSHTFLKSVKNDLTCPSMTHGTCCNIYIQKWFSTSPRKFSKKHTFITIFRSVFGSVLEQFLRIFRFFPRWSENLLSSIIFCLAFLYRYLTETAVFHSKIHTKISNYSAYRVDKWKRNRGRWSNENDCNGSCSEP